MTRPTSRQLAWIEISLGLLLPSILWVIFAPALVAVLLESRSAGSTAMSAATLLGGFAGLVALWSLVLPVALGRARPPDATLGWRGGAIAAGFIVSAVLLWLVLSRDEGAPRSFEWLIAGAAVAPAIVAVHQLVRRS